MLDFFRFTQTPLVFPNLSPMGRKGVQINWSKITSSYTYDKLLKKYKAIIMIKQIALAITSASLLSACVHTTPMPVQTSQPGDAHMSCQSIVSEMEEMTSLVKAKDSELNGQVAKNSALGVTGVFLVVPLFFMDTSDAKTVEGQAAKNRFKKLQQIYADKKCVAGESTKVG